jgi:hypothetical protein
MKNLVNSNKVIINSILVAAAAICFMVVTFFPSHTSALSPAGALSGASHTVAFDNGDCAGTFIGLVPWYDYLPQGEISSNTNPGPGGAGISTTKCDIACFNITPIPHSEDPNKCGNRGSDIPFVLLAIIDDLLRISGLAALGFVFYAAFKYVGSQGSPEGTASAQSTLINALIGMAIAATAVFFVSFLGKKLT